MWERTAFASGGLCPPLEIGPFYVAEVANEGIADFLASRFLRDAVAKAEKFAYAGSIEGEFALARQAGGPSYRALARCTPVKRTSGLPLWMRAEKPISKGGQSPP